MEYLKSAIELKDFITATNQVLLSKNNGAVNIKNLIRVFLPKQDIIELEMESYTDVFVKKILESYKGNQSFVMTDVAETVIEGKSLSYYLYKGYDASIEKGLVYFQLFDKVTCQPIGTLQFSNLEDNVFYSVNAPDKDESSCNAMETEKKIEKGKNIVFLIGHMDEERLLYDIQRLIFDTVNNVQKHKAITFEFIINISKFGGKPSDDLRKQVKAIDEYTQTYVKPAFPNSTFLFEFDN